MIDLFYFQAKRLQHWAYKIPGWATLYGFTKNEITGQYLLVLRYFQRGDLRKCLQQSEETTWIQKIEMIKMIALNMQTIHDAGLIHR